MVFKIEPFFSDRLQEGHKFVLLLLRVGILDEALRGKDYDGLVLQVFSNLLCTGAFDALFFYLCNEFP